MDHFLNVIDASLDPANIKGRLKSDPVGRFHFRAAALESVAAARFSKIQQIVLRGMPSFPFPEVRIALNLILFDGIATYEDLERALAQVNSIYRWQSELCLDWRDSLGRVNRRYISLFTQAAMAVPRASETDVATALVSLNQLLMDLVHGSRQNYSLDLLLLDAQAWLAENVADPLVAHCIRAVPIASLPCSALVREETKLALVSDRDPAHRHALVDGLARALGAYLDQSGADHGSWFVAELVQHCRRNKSLSNAEDKKRMLVACRKLVLRADVAGPISGLILAWVIDLLESGTRGKINLKAITPAKYVAAAAIRLMEAFRGKSIEQLSAQNFIAIYKKMLHGLSSSQARTLASALSSWHFFLSCWLDVEPLCASLHKWIPAPSPKANMIWCHEIDLVRSWVEVRGSDERFQLQLKVAFEILAGIRIRAAELLKLRICNIQFENELALIEIATRAIDSGVKTAAGRRTQSLREEHAIKLLREWIKRRKQDGALPEDYLFGDPYCPERQYKIGQLYLTLNRLIKAATGDITAGTHAFSHTRVSIDWDGKHDSSLSIADINPFEERAVEAGHESAGTGFAHYFHFPERWLREELDQVIAERLELWPTIRSHVALSASAFRQVRARRLRRNPGETPGGVALYYIKLATPYLCVPKSSDGWKTVEPENPLQAQEVGPLDLAGTLNLLNDIWYGHSPKAISLRSGLSPDLISAYVSASHQILQLIGEAGLQFRDQPVVDPIFSLGQILNGRAGQRIQLSRAGQDKVGCLYDFLASNLQGEVAQKGIDSWLRCYRAGYLSLEKPAAAAGFASLLDAAEFPRALVVVRATEKLDTKICSGIDGIFSGNHAITPIKDVIRQRHGRPQAYLALASGSLWRDKNKGFPNAALGMTGVHAVMFAAAVCGNAQKVFENSMVIEKGTTDE